MPERDEATYFAMLKSNKSFYYLRRRAAPGIVEAVNALGEPGIALEREPDRLYPQTSLAAHVVGYTDIDGQGVAGIERALNDQLSDPASRGHPVQLAISSRIQQAMEHELLSAMTKFSAKGAAGVIMDIHTGEVLALTSLPQLNPNAAGQGSPEARFNRATLGSLGTWLDLQAVHRRDGDGQRDHQKLRQDVPLPARLSGLRQASFTTRTRTAAPAPSPRS